MTVGELVKASSAQKGKFLSRIEKECGVHYNTVLAVCADKPVQWRSLKLVLESVGYSTVDIKARRGKRLFSVSFDGVLSFLADELQDSTTTRASIAAMAGSSYGVVASIAQQDSDRCSSRAVVMVAKALGYDLSIAKSVFAYEDSKLKKPKEATQGAVVAGLRRELDHAEETVREYRMAFHNMRQKIRLLSAQLRQANGTEVLP